MINGGTIFRTPSPTESWTIGTECRKWRETLQTKPALSDEIKVVEKGGLVLLSFPRFAPEQAVKQVISTRLGGVSRGHFKSLNLSAQVGDDPIRVFENRELFRSAAGYKKTHLVQAKQIHSDIVLKIGVEDLK